MDSLVSLKNHETERREGQKRWVPRHVLKICKTDSEHASPPLEMSNRGCEVLREEPCMDEDQHHTSPTSELSGGSSSLMFLESVL